MVSESKLAARRGNYPQRLHQTLRFFTTAKRNVAHLRLQSRSLCGAEASLSLPMGTLSCARL